MKKSTGKGTADQMLAKFEAKLSTMQSDNIDSATDIESNSKFMHSGSADDMLNAFKDALHNDVDASTKVTADDEIEEIDINDYINPLMSDLSIVLNNTDEVINWNWRIDDDSDNVYVLIIREDNQADEYQIPFDDLSGELAKDIKKILKAMNIKDDRNDDQKAMEEAFDDDIYTCTKVNANRKDTYFGETKAKEFGELISTQLKGQKISKRRDLAEAPGGLIYEANELGIDMWDLLEALEGMCADGRAREIDDSTYQVIGGKAHPVRSLFGAENIYSQHNVIDWLREHETAYNDACNYFHTDNLEDVAPADLEDWIIENDQLWEDYCNFFDIEACNSIKASEVMYLDPDGNMFGEPRARYSFSDIKRYWDEEHDDDPVLMQFNSFDEWFNACESDGTIVEIDEYSHGRKFQDVGGGFGTGGDILDEDDLFEYYQSNREYDPSLVEYDSYDDWINDSINNGWLSVIDSCDAVNCSIELTDDMKEKVWEIADRYNTSSPVSGDWATETAHEQRAIANELNISLSDAKQIMISELGFSEEMMSDEDGGFVDAATNTLSDEEPIFGDTTGYRYLLTHGWGPGTIPRDVEVLDHVEQGYKDIILINRKLTPDELNEYDIIVLDDSGKATPAVNASKSVKAFVDTDISSMWKKLDSKQVKDFDGFMTDYTLYESQSPDTEYKYICMFGDNDIYTPNESEADWSGNSLSEAEEWFSNYTTNEDDI